ncbi:MAG: hypothetical protein EXS68_03130 [Candidatus Ryanbacteria bacterium]|nr:hypothetical protein [Candidatus Ryanbacteria bacterium]
MKKPIYRWYVEGIDSHTNAAIALWLEDDTRAQKGLRCEDGVRRNLWLCDYSFVRRLQLSRQDAQLDFLVFSQRGNGAIRRWRFTRSRKQVRVALAQKLRQIKARHHEAS